MKRLLLFIFITISFPRLFCGAGERLFAQKYSISGLITDSIGKPMPSASVYVQELQRGTIADSNGRYEISSLSDGKYTLKVSFIGCKTKSYVLNIHGKSIYMDIPMEEEAVDMSELVILPDGMDFAHYIMYQLEKNIRPLKKRLRSYDCTTTSTLSKNIDLSTLRKKHTIRFALSLVGFAKIFDIMMKYPDFSLTMAEDLHFDRGNVNTEKLRVLKSTPKLTDREMKSVMKKDWFMDGVAYDQFYDLVEKKIKSLKSRKNKYELSYRGSYEEDGQTIYIVEYGRTHVEIVDGCWQIRRIKYKSSSRSIYVEFQQLSSGVYLPVSANAAYDIDYDGYPKGKAQMSMGFGYRKIMK